MANLLYCTLNLFCVMILSTILVRMYRSVDKRQGQIMLIWFIIASVILCISDVVWGIVDFSQSWIAIPQLSFAVNGVYHIFTGVVCYLWFLFCESEQNSRIVKSRTGIILSTLPFIALVGMVVLSFRYNLIFYIDADGVYHRGKHYILLIAICYAYLLTTSVKAFAKSRKKENYANRQHYQTLASFCIVPAITGVLQVLFVGSPMLSAGLAFAALQVYMDSMEQLISVDPMTMLNNKGQMIKYLDNKMKNRSDKHELTLFIMDLDYFKRINDNYGHVEGDEAIVIAADAIRRVISKTNFFGCRYGGDEFVVVAETEIAKGFKPKEFIEELNEELLKLTAEKGKEYTLCFSVGYKKFDDSIEGVADFMEKADDGLYRIKNARPRLKDIL